MGVVTLPPQSVISISNAIGDLCTFRELGDLMQICYGTSVAITGVSFAEQPRRKVARDCVDWAQKCGILTNFVAIVLHAKNDNTAFRDLVTQLIPDALTAPPSVASQVGTVVSGLDSLAAYLAKDEVRKKAGISKQRLAEIGQRINLLAAYKGLHDSLHHIQINHTRILLQAVASMDNPISYETVQVYISQVRATVIAIRTQIARPGADEILAGLDLSWVDDLESSSQRCQEGLEADRPGPVLIAIRQIASISDSQSVQLNKGIFDAATKLPLPELASALVEIGAADTGLLAALDEAIVALGALQRSLMSRIATHNRLQKVEQNLSILASCLDDPGVLIVDEIAALWPETRAMLLNLAVLGLERADLTVDAEDCDKIDACLQDVEIAQRDTAFNLKSAPAIRALQRSFSGFQKNASAQFFALDSRLKADFDSVFQISDRLRSILGAVP
ncbi:hypothetical protein BA190_22565 [Labrys sp. WJW]|uniref:hypothetical protein n=1 Tax=Labrys sp. WJW TaxID=1737983 RepID=UPI00082AB663|nr:hypothetical protein [Labrys sp. WJW]OCC02495.1 hypothetical protein BA190_22565 [Labrys sp. WJW]